MDRKASWTPERRLGWTLSSLIVLLMAVYSGALIARQQVELREQAERHGQALARGLTSIGSAAVEESLFIVQEALSRGWHDPDIRRVVVLDREHMVVASSDIHLIGDTLADPALREAEARGTESVVEGHDDQGHALLMIFEPLYAHQEGAAEKAVGWIRVDISLERVLDQAYGTLVRQLLVTLLLLVATVYVVRKTVRRLAGTLRESEERFAAFMDNNPAVAFMKDEEGRMVYVNQAFERRFNMSRSDWQGKADFDLWPSEIAQQLREHDLAVLAADKAAELVETVPTPDGHLRTWIVYKFPLREPSGRRFLGGLALDITERKRLEEQLLQAQKMEAVGQLAGGIAHDFNNLLTVITGYSQLLLSRLGQHDPLRSPMEEIAKAAVRAATLTRQLLAFSRKQVLEPKVLDLNDVVTNLGGMLRRLIGEDIELVTRLGSALGRVKADPGQLDQVMMNLIVNARDAMPKGGTLTIETANVDLDDGARRPASLAPGAYVMLAISDAGCGMDADTQAHLFEPFFTTKEQGKGTGLGLSTVYGIVKQSGGDIRVESAVGRGTAFAIYLPRVPDEMKVVQPDHVRATRARGLETVLLVEDEPMVRKLAREVLQSQGYTVLESSTGSEALRICQEHPGPIHLLLTDVVMPGLSGRETAERLIPLRPAMKALYMSGYTDDAIVRHGVLEADTAFLHKPFTPEVLACKVREVLDAPQRGSHT